VQVQLPPDIHPLPDDVTAYVRVRLRPDRSLPSRRPPPLARRAQDGTHPPTLAPAQVCRSRHCSQVKLTAPFHNPQFVYPHSLEAQALPSLHASLATLRASHAARLATLADAADAKEHARKALLNRLAPGWSEGGGGVMEPSRAKVVGGLAGAGAGASAGGGQAGLADLGVSRKSLEETRAELLAESGEGGAERDAMVDLVDGLMALDAAGGKRPAV